MSPHAFTLPNNQNAGSCWTLMIAFTLETNKLKEAALCGAERRYTIQDTLAVQQNESHKI